MSTRYDWSNIYLKDLIPNFRRMSGESWSGLLLVFSAVSIVHRKYTLKFDIHHVYFIIIQDIKKYNNIKIFMT